MQLTDIRDEVRLRMGLSSSDANFTDTHLNTLINAALRQVSTHEDWPWLEKLATAATVASTETITLASDVRKVTFMRHEYRELRYVNFRDRALYYNLTGYPNTFSVYAGNWYIWPTPDAAYTISYGYIAKTEPTLSLDADEPLMPDWAISLCITYACVLAARRSRDRELEKVFYAEYADLMRTIRDDTRLVTLGLTPRRIGNRGAVS